MMKLRVTSGLSRYSLAAGAKTIASMLFATLLLAACASTPTWDGMSENEIAAWRSLNIEAGEAQSYRKAGLDTDAVEAWRDAGLQTSQGILTWHKAGWTSTRARPWINKGFDLETTSAWSADKFTASQAREWVDAGFSLKQAIDNRAKGLTPVR